jgi:hypothetical protein
MSSLGGLMTEYVFETPTVREGPAGAHRLFYFYKLDVAVSIVKDNGVYEQVRYLLDEDLSSFEEVYLGGRNHIVSEATKAALIAGDVGVTESNFTAI